MCYVAFGTWVLTQILSVTVFTAHCINMTESSNDRQLRERIWETPYPAHFSKFIRLRTMLSLHRTGSSHRLHIPRVVLVPFCL